MEQLEQALAFGPFRLLPLQRQLWKDRELLEIRAMPMAVLTYLAQHPERVVPAEELRKAVWGGIYVSRTAIRVCVREIRQALGDEAATPRYIETVGRQGYCFIGYGDMEVPTASERAVAGQPAQLTSESESPPVPFVGRQRELAQLRRWFVQAQQGERQVILVSGEPGIGKTTLIKQFVQFAARLLVAGAIWIGYGQCVEAYGQGEAYLPVLEALGRLGREGGIGELRAVLQQHAPTWLGQLPALVDSGTREELQRQGAGATQERMLRELCDALEVLTVEQPLLLVLEDLHWSDTATLAWLAAVARRPDPARLMVIGTYRPTDVILQSHPLRGLIQELHAHRLCREVRLEGLGAEQVREYVRQRFANSAVADVLGPRLYERTDGNPLFLTASVDALIQHGVVVEGGEQWVMRGDLTALEGTIPEDLQQLISKQVEALSTEARQMLGVASVSGLTFTAAEVKAGCKLGPEVVEEACEQLAQHGQMIKGGEAEEWPDRTLTARYSFRHTLYQQVVYARLGGGQKVRLHRLIGERREAGYEERVGEIAGELALHFERGRDYQRAVRYRQIAAEQASRRSAYQEAVAHCRHGLALLTALPDTHERIQHELTLQVALSVPLTATTSWAAPEVERAYTRALELCQQMGDTPQLFTTLWGLWAFYFTRGEYKRTRELAERLLSLAQGGQNSTLLLEGHYTMGVTLSHLGEFASARVYLEQGLALYDAHEHRSLADTYGSFDRRAASLWYLSFTLWFLGYPDQALTRGHEAIAVAQQLSHSFSLALALDFAARLHQFRREGQATQELAEAAVALCTEQGFPFCLAFGTIVRSWALAEQGHPEGVLAQMQQGLAVWRTTGAEELQPYFLALLAEVHGQGKQVGKGLTLLAEALAWVDKTGERFYEAELYRLKGELTLQRLKVRGSQCKARKSRASSVQSLEGEAEACFQRAIEVARSQGAKSLELRAAISVSRLWHQQGKTAQAKQVLAEIYGWFTEGFDTKDLQEAKALLKELS